MPEFESAIRAIVWDNRLRRILMGIASGLRLQAQPCRDYSEIHSQAHIRLELRLRYISIFVRAGQTIRFM